MLSFYSSPSEISLRTGLFEIQAEHLSGLGFYNLVQPASRQMLYALFNRTQ
jgi:hypothetical protein